MLDDVVITKLIAVREVHINATEHYRFGDSDVYETYADSSGELFRGILKDGWRCISKMYRETPHYFNQTYPPKVVGWVFQRRDKYEDCNKTFLHEMWIEVVDDYR